MKLWDKLLPHTLFTLNLLRVSCLNPALSTYSQTHGAFGFNKAPIAPPPVRLISWRTKNPTIWGLGHRTPSLTSTHAPRCIITNIIMSGHGRRQLNELLIPPHGIQRPLTCPSPPQLTAQLQPPATSTRYYVTDTPSTLYLLVILTRDRH